MHFGVLMLLALSVSIDNFSVPLSLGMSQPVRVPGLAFRLPLTFGACQFLMPLLGWLAGSQVAFLFRGYERWPLFASLIFVGWRMLRSTTEPDKAGRSGPLAAGTIIGLALVTSLDSLMVGFGLAIMHDNILLAGAVFGAVGAVLSAAGMLCGTRLGQSLGRHGRFAGGLTLIILGIRAFGR